MHKHGVLGDVECTLIIAHERNWTNDWNFEKVRWPKLSALEIKQFPKRLQQCSNLIPIFNVNIFIYKYTYFVVYKCWVINLQAQTTSKFKFILHIHFDNHDSSPQLGRGWKFSSSLINHNLRRKQHTLYNHSSLLNTQGPIISPHSIVVVIWFHLLD
jgi:hypothetical protein